MNLTHYLNIYIAKTLRTCLSMSALLVMLSACKEVIEVPVPVYTVGEADNAIVLTAGISEGGAGVMTRAAEYGEHSNHVGFKTGTQIAMRVDGTWTGHDPVDVKKKTIATLGDASDKHNPLNAYNPVIYWDDYGTADPANAAIGRTQGLTIYAAAVDGKTELPAALNNNLDNTVAKWQDLSWNVGSPTDGKIDQTGGFGDYDLLTSNNITSVNSNTYKFAQKNDGKLMEFTHAMTKITVNLTAGKGFPGSEGDDITNAKFQTAPTVTLLGFNYTGTVNVETKTSTPTAEMKTNILTHLADGGATQHTAKYEALVFPGNCFESTTEILSLSADGNGFKVTATKLNAAISAAKAESTSAHYNATDNTLLQAVNYVINITVNKTDIDVDATIKDWETLVSETVSPVINVNANYGGTGTALSKDAFSFYRSEAMDNGYSQGYSGNNNGYFAAEATVNKSSETWTFSTPLYWPDHKTHYQMRGVWPVTSVETSATTSPRVKESTNNSGYQVIEVENVAYEAEKFPSDLAIGRPDVATTATCNNSDHTAVNLYTGGICATEGKITLAFEYMMSKVEVILSTTDGADAVTLVGAKVEVTNLFTTGDVKLGDRETVVTGSTSDYTLNVVAGGGNENKRLDAIVPQVLTYSEPRAETNVRFKITITNNDAVPYANAAEYNAAKGTSLDDAAFAALSEEEKTKTPATTDIYYTDVNPILKSGSTTEKIAPNGKWESGKHYVYKLKLSKTKIDVTATFKDWETVSADTNVWF